MHTIILLKGINHTRPQTDTHNYMWDMWKNILEGLTSVVGADGLGEVGEIFTFYFKYLCTVECVTMSICYS